MGLTVVPLPIEGKTVFICVVRSQDDVSMTAWATQYDAWVHARDFAVRKLDLPEQDHVALNRLDNRDWTNRLASFGLFVSVDALKVGSAEGMTD